MTRADANAASASSLLEGYATEIEVAAARGVTVRALRAERQRADGPPWIRVNRAIYYSRDGFRRWLEAIEVRPVRSGGKAA